MQVLGTHCKERMVPPYITSCLTCHANPTFPQNHLSSPGRHPHSEYTGDLLKSWSHFSPGWFKLHVLEIRGRGVESRALHDHFLPYLACWYYFPSKSPFLTQWSSVCEVEKIWKIDTEDVLGKFHQMKIIARVIHEAWEFLCCELLSVALILY